MNPLIHSYISVFREESMKDKIVSILFVGVLVFFMAFHIFLPDKEVSVSERRKLKQIPTIQISTILDGTFFSDFTDYVVEQFPFRDFFRKVKGITASKLFGKQENNGVFIKEDTIYQLNATLDEKSVNHMVEIIKNIQSEYLTSKNLYYGIIPDKNYYLSDKTIPKLDYLKLQNIFEKNLKDMEYINLFDSLTLDSYYKTDIHWRQEKLENVVTKIQDKMKLEETVFPKEKKNYPNFYGALYGRIASNLRPDELTYVSNQGIEEAMVYVYEKDNYQKVYEESYLHNIDSYDVFLAGATPLLVIENKNQVNGRELILFRDSFGSSLAPLLISNYSKITMIDLRYISSKMLDQVGIGFEEDQDVLFLYSVPIINNSLTLK